MTPLYPVVSAIGRRWHLYPSPSASLSPRSLSLLFLSLSSNSLSLTHSFSHSRLPPLIIIRSVPNPPIGPIKGPR